MMPPKFLGGEVPDVQGKDRRVVLAKWLASSRNPWFATSFANRVWAHFTGVGIVEPVDDFRVSNPASNAELLEELGKHFTETKYSLKALVRDICNSRTYQRSTRRNESNESDEKNFAHALVRRIKAENLLDTISAVTNTKDKFEGLPIGARAVQIADGTRSTYFLKTFGRATRETPCSCEVKMEPTLSQALHLLNGGTVTDKIRQGGLVAQACREQEIARRTHNRVVRALLLAEAGQGRACQTIAADFQGCAQGPASGARRYLLGVAQQPRILVQPLIEGPFPGGRPGEPACWPAVPVSPVVAGPIQVRYETMRSKLLAIFLSASASLGVGAVSAAIADDPPKEKVTYQENVVAVFRNRCGSCHNPDKQKGGLNLDNYGSAMQGGGSGKVIEPGNAENSTLFLSITHKEEPKMPPNSPKIPDAEIELIRKWIDGGALENAGSKAVAAAKPKFEFKLDPASLGKPSGTPAMPENLATEPFVPGAQPSAVVAMAASPWAP